MASAPLKNGCYYISFTCDKTIDTEDFFQGTHFHGTMRVEQCGGILLVSADLYQSDEPVPDTSISGTADSKESLKRVPVFSFDKYKYYLQGTDFKVTAQDEVTRSFELTVNRRNFRRLRFFGEMLATLKMQRKADSNQSIFEGALLSDGKNFGQVTMHWVSPYYRRATVEIDKVEFTEFPWNNGENTTFRTETDLPPCIDWHNVYNGLGWDVTVIMNDSQLPDIEKDGWQPNELHAFMIRWRDLHKHDKEWRYYLLCVSNHHHEDGASTTFLGLMFDRSLNNDTNNFPREGGAIFSHSPVFFPQGSDNENMPLVNIPAAYFRTALHELGHMMGLDHDKETSSLMRGISNFTNPENFPEFPRNFGWTFSAPHQILLRHMPDMWVRPGGVEWALNFAQIVDLMALPLRISEDIHENDPVFTFLDTALATFNNSSAFTWRNIFQHHPEEHGSAEVHEHSHTEHSSPEISESLHFSAENISSKEVPFGAPLRVNLSLFNESDTHTSFTVPESISFKYGHLSATIKQLSNDTTRQVRPMIRFIDIEETMRTLAPKERVFHSFTLLHGSDGALFPTPGEYELVFTLHWHHDDHELNISSIPSKIRVVPPKNNAQQLLAEKIIATPELTELIVFPGNHLQGANALLEEIMNNEVLAPHYTFTKARQYATRFFDENFQEYFTPSLDDPVQACELLKQSSSTIFNGAELNKILSWCSDKRCDNKYRELARDLLQMAEKMYQEGVLFEEQYLQIEQTYIAAYGDVSSDNW